MNKRFESYCEQTQYNIIKNNIPAAREAGKELEYFARIETMVKHGEISHLVWEAICKDREVQA